VGDTFVVRLERKSRSYAYLRPNLLYTRKFVIVHLLFLFPRRSDGPAGTKTTVNVLLFLLRWFQDLYNYGQLMFKQIQKMAKLTWNEHSKLSSTLIIAPALSNSPQ